MMGAERSRYRAFISYSHQDRADGDQLFKRLDGYRVPKVLQGRDTVFGPVPKKLYPIFRDRDELPTSPNLTARIQAAMETSDHLVVVCSPRAASSDWVNAEVETFRRLGKADRIHAVLVDGEPTDAFPPALTGPDGAEPIAADLRETGDGWSDGALKVIAGILGLGFGELKDREIARARARARRNAAIAAVFALLAAIAGISAWRAVEQTHRAEAELTRAEAAILTAVEGVAAIVDQVATGSESGAIPTAVAGRLLTTADGLIAGIIAVAPSNPRLLEEQGNVLILFARHYRNVGDLGAAHDAAKRAHDLYASLEAQGGQFTERAMRSRSMALIELGDALVATGDRNGALVAYEESSEIVKRLADEDPENTRRQRDVFVSLFKIGSFHEGSGGPGVTARDLDSAIAAYTESHEIVERLAAADPKNATWKRDVSVILSRIGNVRLAASDPAGALTAYEESLRIAQHQADTDPGNDQWAADVSMSLSKVGKVRMAAGDVDGALSAYNESLNVAQRLANDDPGNVQWQRNLLVLNVHLAEMAEANGTPATAGQHYASALRIAETLKEQSRLARVDEWMLEDLRRRIAGLND